ncbi:MAG: DNA topoisomerase I, partial [Candidatus Odinarchaeota archaeon]|nr:DNA topoisomerase I [Candidatus Odinarchaeota archaeon]
PMGDSKNKENKVLVITEKPTAMKRIAEALSDGKIVEESFDGIPYYEVNFNGDRLRLISASGHLFKLKQVGKGWKYPVYESIWAPISDKGKKELIIKIINAIRELSRDVDYVINACDYDVEGSVIGYLIIREIIGEDFIKKAKRAKFSSLTREELRNSFKKLQDTLNFNLVEAGLTRHKVDWLFGINLTRALTISLKTQNRFKILSVGRVQGPLLSFIVKREKEINSFVPDPYWVIEASVRIGEKNIPLEFHRSKIESLEEAKRISDSCKKRELILEEKRERRSEISPPYPFDIGSLQSEAYRLFGFTPSKTLTIAESLYLDALISYPRSSSQKLPQSLDIRRIIEKLSKQREYMKMCSELMSKDRLTPRNGPKDDPAHPAIHPTGKEPERKLTSGERKVYDLIVRRFLSTLGDPSTLLYTRVTFRLENTDEFFFLRGKRVINPGWIKFYGPYYKSDTKEIPEISGERFKIGEVRVIEKFTNPPSRYNPGSLLKLMEKNEIGTKATRARIIDILYKRGYIREKSIRATPLAFAVVEVLERYCPEILSVSMTRSLEEDMENIISGRSDGEEVIGRSKEILDGILEKFKKYEVEVGAALLEALNKYYEDEKVIGRCPKCGGKLMVIRSSKTGKRFVICSNVFEGKCDVTLPLPQKGIISPLGSVCKRCGFPMIKIYSGGKAWVSCVNWINCKKGGGK